MPKEQERRCEAEKMQTVLFQEGRLWYNRGVLNRDDRRNLVEITNVLPNQKQARPEPRRSNGKKER